MDLDDLTVPTKGKISLQAWDPNDRLGFDGEKEDAQVQFADLCNRIADLQRDIFVNRRHKILIVLQGMDTSGKNGTIRRVFRMTDPTSVHVASFDKPTRLELAHDFLWRVHQRCPANGEIVIFDRSHYEDITAVAVNNLAPESLWRKRFDHINAFERLLVDEGTVVLKFFLHIDLKEQKERLQARLADPAKHWKFDQSDLIARKRWDDYMKIYEEVFARTSTEVAPWYIVPSNRKWLRNMVVAKLIVRRLEQLDLRPPKVPFDPEEIEFD